MTDSTQRVRESFARQEVMRTLGAELRRVEPGEVLIVLPFRPALTQQHGFLHAGIITTVLDSACGYATYTLMAEDRSYSRSNTRPAFWLRPEEAISPRSARY